VDWFELCHDPATANDRVALSAMLDRVEKIGEPSGGIGGCYLRHEIRLSDWSPLWQRSCRIEQSGESGRGPEPNLWVEDQLVDADCITVHRDPHARCVDHLGTGVAQHRGE
jgi:hypothetical protein